MRRGFRIGRPFGVDLVIDATWPIIGFLVSWGLYADAVVRFGDTESMAHLLVVAICGSFLFFASVVAHELGHSIAARRRGIRTIRIRLFVLGGLAEIEREASSPSDEFAIAAAGPATSLLVGGVFVGLAWLVSAADPWERMIRFVGIANLILGVFNLVPGFPLDGGRVLRAIVWRITGDADRATRVAVAGGRLVALLLVAAGVYFFFFETELGGLWWIAIGWFLYQAAAAAQTEARARAALEGVTARDVMTPIAFTVDAAISLQELHDGYLLASRHDVFPVEAEGRVRGLVGLEELRAVPRPEWGATSAVSVMQVLRPEDVFASDDAVQDLFRRLPDVGDRAVVVESGRLVGIVTAADLARWARRAALGETDSGATGSD
jgi:Zn-dependent protease/CBS domain-containing protein